MVVVRLTGWLCLCLGMVCVPLDVGASAPLGFALDYRVPPGVVCPDATAVAAAADREVGRSVVDAGSKRKASLVISKSGDELTARVAFTDASGAEQAVRSVSATTDRCAELVRVFGLLVALHLQAVENEEGPAKSAAASSKANAPPPAPRAKPSKTPPPAPTPPPPPPPTLAAPKPVVAVTTPLQVSLVRENEKPAPLVRAGALWLGPIVRTGLAPGANPGVRFGVGWQWQPSLRVNAELDGVWAGQTQVAGGGAYEVGAGVFGLSACWSRGPAVLQGWLCPAVSAGVVRVVGKALDVARSDVALIAMAGVDGRLSFAVGGSWIAELVVSAAFNPRPHSVSVNDANVWKAQRTLFTGAAVLGYRWGTRSKTAPWH